MAHIREYLPGDGGLDVLADVLDLDRAARFLRDPAAAPAGANQTLAGVHTAAVLLSEDWRGHKAPKCPVAITTPAADRRSHRITRRLLFRRKAT